jgi:hypothetical protein
MSTKQVEALGLTTLALQVVPVPFQWDGETYGTAWDTVLPDPEEWTAAQRRQWWEGRSTGRELHEDEDEALEMIRDHIQDNAHEMYAPVMSYYYPLPDLRMSAEAAQAKLDTIRTSCVVVLVGDEPALALAGGGMDLSWDICRAYIALGYYPPAHFAGDLPLQGEADVSTAEVCVESCRIVEGWAKRNTERAAEVLAATRKAKAAK